MYNYILLKVTTMVMYKCKHVIIVQLIKITMRGTINHLDIWKKYHSLSLI